MRPGVVVQLVLVSVCVLAFADVAPAKKAKPVACDPGRFVVEGAALVPAGASPDVVVYGGGIAIDSGCGGVAGKIKATKKGTVVRAKWASCAGVAGKATLVAKIAADCATMTGTFRAKKAKVKRKFTAQRSRCGDGSLDVAGGEACEGAAGCASGSCTTTCTCEPTGGANGAPVAAFAAGATVAAGTALAFDGSGSTDPDGDPLAFGWDFGDGGRGGAPQLAHVFATAGSFAVTLTVSDGRGGTASTQQTITVTAGPSPGPTVTVAGHVEALDGGPLSGVTVAIVGGGVGGTTDTSGDVAVNVPTGVPVLLRLSRAGYVDHLEPVSIPTGGGDAIFEAAMIPQGAVQSLADAAAGGTVTGTDGAVLQVPAGALVDDDGTPVTGAVQVALTPVDPTVQPQAFPGRFAGILPDGTDGLLVSGGTVEFDLARNGGGVNLAPGARATVELPIYATLRPDGTPLVPGDTVPLWALDERTGTWVQEGSGTVVTSAGSPTGLALRGEVGHLSWWNVDYFDDAPYEPKPKCCIDTNLDGTCEDLSLTGYCWHYGTGPDQPEPFGPFADTPVLPAFLVETNLPAQGGVALPVPSGRDFLIYSSYQAGTYTGITLVNGASGVSEEKLIVLQPAGGAATPITVPHDDTYVIVQEGEVDRYVFSATADDPIYVTVSRDASGLNAEVFLDGPGSNDLGPFSMGSNPVTMGFLAPVTGDYRIAVEGTGGIFDEDGAGYRLEVKPTGSFPLVVSRTPAADATGVASSATISATFTVPIDAASVSAMTFQVENPGGPVDGTFMVSGATVTFTPSDPLAAGVPHTVTLTGLLASGGTGLPSPVSWSFSTVDQVGVGAIIAKGTEPRVAVDANGNAFALMQGGATSRDVAVSRYTPGAGWTAPQTLRQSDSPYSLRIAMTPSGDSAIAVWKHEAAANDGTRNVYASRWTAATGWSTPPAQIDDLATNPASGGTGNGDNRGLELAMDTTGNAIAVWNDPNGNGVTQDRIYWNRYVVGSGWQGEVEIGNVGVGGILTPPVIAMNASGAGVVAWGAKETGEDAELLVRRFSGSGATLHAAEPLVSTASFFLSLSVGVDPTGNLFTLWRIGGNVDVRRWDADMSTWEAAVPLRTADGGQPGFACTDDDEIGVAADGTALVTGCSVGTTTTYRVQYTPDAGSGTWGTPATSLYDVFIADVASVVETNGDAWVTVMNALSDATSARLWRYRASGPQAGWDTDPTPIAALKNNGGGISGAGSRPRVYVGPSGHAFAANYYFEGFTSKVVVVRLE